MIIGYISESNFYISLLEQKKIISDYASKLKLGDVEFVKIPKSKNIFSYPMKKNDTFIISDVSMLGAKFEEIMLALKNFSEKKIKIYSAKEKILIDSFSPRPLEENVDTCLKLYKGIFSLRNSQIQKNLLKQGKQRGRPKGSGSFFISRIDEVKALIKQGKTTREIADFFNTRYQNMYVFIKRNNLRGRAKKGL